MASFMSFCPHCNNMLSMEEEWRGMEVTCPHCGEKFIIPKDTSAAASPAPANAPLQLFPESRKKSNLIWKIGGAAVLFIIVAAWCFIFLANRFQTPEPKSAKREKQSVTVAENKPQRASVKPPVANSGKNSLEVAGKTPENGRKNISSTNIGNSSLRNSGVSRNVSGSPRNDGMSKISNNQKKHNKSVVDRDNDGVPDEKEIRCGMNPDDPFD
ncbi:MAG: hypothetical protein J6C40_00595, partial [Lentisphaeria bacterium]|nr:hypothetical protein [Lentisphaeria bacterium]